MLDISIQLACPGMNKLKLDMWGTLSDDAGKWTM